MEVRFSAEEQVREAVFEAVSKLRESNQASSISSRRGPSRRLWKRSGSGREALLAELMRRREELLQKEPVAPAEQEPPRSERCLSRKRRCWSRRWERGGGSETG
ncbi:MAG: hypothetical protein ACLTDS_04850 [Bianqueaceae bacterium]